MNRTVPGKAVAVIVGGLLLGAVTAAAAAQPPAVDPSQPPVPRWVWAQGEARDNQWVYFRATFESGLKAGEVAKSAALFCSADDEWAVFVNGKKVGQDRDWEQPTVADVSAAVVPGENLVAVRAWNREGSAGMVLKLRVVRPDGTAAELVSDETWRTAPDGLEGWQTKAYDDSDWRPARVVAPYGEGAWGAFFKGAGVARATPAESLTVLPGFKAELLYSVPRETQGSWVCMTPDDRGRLIVGAQNHGLFRVTPGKDAGSTSVEPLAVEIGHAQGLLYAHDSLYVVVNAQDGKGAGGRGSGLWRLRDTDDDEQFDQVKRLTAFEGRGGGMAGGEHGPHAVVAGPDGKLYVVAGNFTRLPAGLSFASYCRGWAEDQLLPRLPDGAGHDPTIWAPAGWVCRTDPAGRNWELVCTGLRNAYDIAFNGDGELFTYDSDMEWDVGTPWYRPTRVLMVAGGGEYGWRNGSGKWPDYYPDSLPAVANTGLGSPTGVTFGTGAKFPAKYQRAMFCVDWAYGKIYAVHLTPVGAGYRATFDPFVTGRAWDGTDAVINPADGAMYVTIGGRGTQSGLYRISYVGGESTAPVKPEVDRETAEARALRRKLEAFQGRLDDAAVEAAWPHLNSSDRYLRYAARMALESQPLEQWRDRALAERRPTAAVNALVALIRAASVWGTGTAEDAGGPNVPRYGGSPDDPADGGYTYTARHAELAELRPKVLAALGALPLGRLSEEQLLEALRAYGLCFIRLGRPGAEEADGVASKLDALYPSQSTAVNRELGLLLAYLQSPNVAARSMKLLRSAATQEDRIHYAMTLRFVNVGWSVDDRKAYFEFLNDALANYRGGNSFRAFLVRMRRDAESTLSVEERVALGDLLTAKPRAAVSDDADRLPPRQFVRNWQMQDLLPVIDQATRGRDFERGRAAFTAAQCAKCHRFGDEGGGTGPDLTGVGNRFQPADVLESILLPSKVISDQYQTTEIITNDRDVIAGHVEAEDDERFMVRTNPFAAEAVAVPKKDVARRRPGRLSMMPEGLVDVLERDEILDLVAYLRSAGKPDDPAFQREPAGGGPQ